MRSSFVLLALLLCSALAPAARAADQQHFGDAGEAVVYGAASFSYTNSNQDGSSGLTTVSLSPTVLGFAAQNLAIGASLNINFLGVNGASTVAAGIAPVLAYNLWLGDRVSLFPELSLGFGLADLSGGDGGSVSSFVFTPAIALPILWHPASHFFLGLGPAFSASIYGNSEFNNAYVIGVSSLVGGAF